MPADGERSRHRAPAAQSRSSARAERARNREDQPPGGRGNQPPRGRSRDDHSARGRSRDDQPPHDHELDSYLAALAPEVEEGGTESTGRFGTAQVFQLRLPPSRVEQLSRLAAERGVSPGSLALDWVVERLDREDMPTGPLERVVDEPRGRRRAPFRRRKP
ncbi:hypothetical protein [Pseudonocardia sp. N23]|uniref:hypothetical protein n=1 Tax=Pseudonocardia sp. N23 TaxID=1987376 RepID=UPI000C036E25|nr:hypothetical protein [Pseudonocardia sp. N23]GAY12876.1 hypothetical protein TOK_1429 [Pseudonocardia sp. N23]